jgi:hypothetical protein
VPATVYTWRQGGTKIVAWFKDDQLHDTTAALVGKMLALGGGPAGPAPAGPGRVTVANFGKLRQKMTAAEVQAILGPPDREGIGPAAVWLEGRNTIQVHFKDDRLVLANAFSDGQPRALVDFPWAGGGQPPLAGPPPGE